MFVKRKSLEIGQGDLAVIEAALHTQSKILSVQAGAGGSAARERLNEVKLVLTRVTQNRAVEKPRRKRAGFCWFWMSCYSS